MGIVGMACDKANQNGSQFYITLRKRIPYAAAGAGQGPSDPNRKRTFGQVLSRG